jgi:threonine aldolase
VAGIAAVARRHGLRVHMDGARFANAVAASDAPPRALTWEAGVDVLSFGGSKNGIALAEAVVFFDPALAADFDYVRKQGGQLVSKMRYLSAPWAPAIESGTWLRNARVANEAAKRLAAGLRELPGVRLVHPVEANAVFVDLAPALHRALRERWAYHPFEGSGFRFMCSWQTKPAQVEALLADAARVAEAHR